MRPLLLLSILLVPLVALPHRAEAFIVTCANCADIFTQLEEKAMQIQQKLTQLQQYQLQLQQYQNMIQNPTALPQSIWAKAGSDIMQVRRLANAGGRLPGNPGPLLPRLQSAG